MASDIECAIEVRGDTVADPVPAPYPDDGFRDLERQACPVLRAAAILIGPLIRPAPQELVQQVAVCAVDLDAIEASIPGVLGRPTELPDDIGQLAGLQGPGHRDLLFSLWRMDISFDGKRGRRDGKRAVQEVGMGDPSHVPELDENPAAGPVDGVCHLLPACDLRCRVDAGSPHVADTLRADLRALGDNQAGRGSLHVISNGHRARDVGLPCAAACHRRHHDAVWQREIAHSIR